MIAGAGPVLTRAEVVGITLVIGFAGSIVLLYVAGIAGFGVPAMGAIVLATALASVFFVAGWRLTRQTQRPGEIAVLLCTVAIVLAYLGWLAWPSLLPPGGGPDLTHHLLLIDYIERQRSLVPDLRDVARLGEMAAYTPGVHLLAVASGSLLGVAGFWTVYPIVALSVALKFGIFALILLRLEAVARTRIPLAVAGTAWLVMLPAFTIDSFAHDSFLAQVVAELFAVSMFWSLMSWADRPSVWAAAVFGVAGSATFLTWPVWIGPLILAAAVVMLWPRATAPSMNWRQLAVAVAPILIVGAVHLAGRTESVSIVATSGAVIRPTLATVGWVLTLLAAPGLVLAIHTPQGRVVGLVSVSLVAQAGALWLLARQSGAATPYMALKMGYLAVYPLTAAAVITLARLPHAHYWARLAAVLAMVSAVAQVTTRVTPTPIVDSDLWRAATWARDHLPTDDIDYLVRNEYTAYWLHLAVLGNSRAAERSTNNETYLTEPSFARWIAETDGPQYAIARSSVLPRDIRERSRVLRQFGDAVIIARSASGAAFP